MRRTTVGLLLFALASLAAGTASATVTDSAVLAVDACATGPDAEDVMSDAHDICDVAVTVTSSVDAPPVLEVAIRTADTLPAGSDHIATLAVGDCVLQFRNNDDLVLLASGTSGPTSDLFVGCGEFEEHCTVHTNDPNVPVQRVNCTNSYDDYHRADAAVTVEGTVLTFSVEASGDHVRLAELLVPNAELVLDWAVASLDLPAFSGGNPIQVRYCEDLEQEDCTNVAGDVVYGEGSLVLSDPHD